MGYHVRLEQFEGPLELLLNLIEKEKLDITRLSLARVADQYLEYLKGGENTSLLHLSAFLSIAARLILLKSRALLPLLTFTEEEETSIQDLEWQLREYQRFHEAGENLGKILSTPLGAYARESFAGTESIFYPPPDLVARHLREAFIGVLGTIPIATKLEEEELATIVTLEDKILHWQEALVECLETSFQKVTESVATRVEVIVAFLALLELVKQRYVHVEQKEFFGDIHVRRIEI